MRTTDTAEARAELREMVRQQARPGTPWQQARAEVISMVTDRNMAAEAKLWRVRYRAASSELMYQLRRKMEAGGLARFRGQLLQAEAAGGNLVDMGFQVESPYLDPYRIGLEEPSDRFSPEQIVAMNAPRRPRRWLPEESI